MKHQNDTDTLMLALGAMLRPERTHMGLAHDMFSEVREEQPLDLGPIIQRGSKILRRVKRPKLMDPVTAAGFFEDDKRKETPRTKQQGEAEAKTEAYYKSVTAEPEPPSLADIIKENMRQLREKQRKYAEAYAMSPVQREHIARLMEEEARRNTPRQKNLHERLSRKDLINDMVSAGFFKNPSEHFTVLVNAKNNLKESVVFPGVIRGINERGECFYWDKELDIMRPDWGAANIRNRTDLAHPGTKRVR